MQRRAQWSPPLSVALPRGSKCRSEIASKVRSQSFRRPREAMLKESSSPSPWLPPLHVFDTRSPLARPSPDGLYSQNASALQSLLAPFLSSTAHRALKTQGQNKCRHCHPRFLPALPHPGFSKSTQDCPVATVPAPP